MFKQRYVFNDFEVSILLKKFFTFEYLLRNVDDVIVLDCESKNWLDNDYEFPSHLKLLGPTLNVSQDSLSLFISLIGSYKIVLTKRSTKIEVRLYVQLGTTWMTQFQEVLYLKYSILSMCHKHKSYEQSRNRQILPILSCRQMQFF